MNRVANQRNGASATNKYRRSPAIWASCPLVTLREHYPEWVTQWDLSRFSLIGTQTTEIAGPIGGTKVFATASGYVKGVSAINSVETPGGAIEFSTDTDNDSASLAEAYPKFLLDGDPHNTGRLWFEACVAVSSLVTNGIGLFVGLAETDAWTLATGVPFNGGDAITNAASAIGFRKEEDGLGVIDAVVSDRATSFTNIEDDTDATSGTGDFVAFTFKKLGMFYNPRDSDRCIRFFSDNVELDTAITRAALQAYTNLDANPLGPIVAQVADSAGTTILTHLKWLTVAQEPPGGIDD
jgi:hypothetical protein